MKSAEGKRADQLTDADYERHLDQWHDELDAMAEHNVLPHVIAIIGSPFWRFACNTLSAGKFKGMKTTRYDSCAGPAAHFIKRVGLEHQGKQHELLLVRLRHPAGRTKTGSPKWLLEQTEFRAMAS